MNRLSILWVLITSLFVSAVHGTDLDVELIKKGRINVFSGYWLDLNYYYENEPNIKYPTGFIFPSNLKEAVKPVNAAYEELTDSVNNKGLSLLSAGVTGILLGIAITNNNNGVKISCVILSIFGIGYGLTKDYESKDDLYRGIYLYNKELNPFEKEAPKSETNWFPEYKSDEQKIKEGMDSFLRKLKQ